MTMELAQRATILTPSLTLSIDSKAKAMKAEGLDVCGFGAGEPDFDTPEHIKQAARTGLDRGVSRYTHVAGLIELRRAVAAELGRAHGVDIGPDQVLVSNGAKHSLYNLFMALLDPGDEVVIPAPYWVSYPDMVLLAGGVPVILPTEASRAFAPDPDRLAAVLTPRTRAIVINTPSNPTGGVFEADTLRAVGELCAARDVLIVSDDIYRSLVYGGTPYTSIASLSPDIARHTVLVDGVSKSYAMTGWRIGYCAGPIELVRAMATIQGQSTSNPSHIAQVAALAALTGPQECVAKMRAAFDSRRREMVARLRAMPGVNLHEPRGAFYCFPDLSAHVGRRSPSGGPIADDVALCNYLVEEGRVAVVPGSGFGAPGFVRLSYACSMDEIRKGLDRMGEALGRLVAP